MIILLFFAFISGLVTILAPCIWPLLPIILSSTTGGGHRKPLGITLGILISFGLLTLTISYIVSIIPFDPNILRYFAVFVIGFLGLTLVIPQLSQLMEGYVSRFSGKLGGVGKNGDGFGSGLITGLALGIVWTPCAGPILATIATLAATQAVNFQIVLVTLAYITGVGIPLFLFARIGQRFLTTNRFLSKYTGIVQQVFGIIMILTALSIATNYDKVLQVKLLDAVPAYTVFLNQFEGNEVVEKELDAVRGKDMKSKTAKMRFPTSDRLPKLANAPEFVGISKWLNTDSPLTMKELKGKVVLVDFWTYTCINCIRTMPYITQWYKNYKDQGFVVVGVHTPEFEFEKKTENVEAALKQYDITYPVAQDNDYETWNAYSNRYWPAHYLIDAEGTIRYIHFGEGKYEETEAAIKELLEEAGKKVPTPITQLQDKVPEGPRTPETYLGKGRAERFASSPDLIIGTFTYKPGFIDQNQFAFSGKWKVQEEYSESVENSKVSVRFEGNKVFLVMYPKLGTEKVQVLLDNEVITTDNAGKDVVDGTITVTEPRLYELVDLKGKDGTHLLELKFLNEGVQVFAFTFGG